MPIYEFECKGCGQHFEELLRNSNSEGFIKCPHCGDGKVERKISVFGFVSQKSSYSSQGNTNRGSCSHCSTHSCSSCRCH